MFNKSKTTPHSIFFPLIGLFFVCLVALAFIGCSANSGITRGGVPEVEFNVAVSGGSSPPGSPPPGGGGGGPGPVNPNDAFILDVSGGTSGDTPGNYGPGGNGGVIVLRTIEESSVRHLPGAMHPAGDCLGFDFLTFTYPATPIIPPPGPGDCVISSDMDFATLQGFPPLDPCYDNASANAYIFSPDGGTLYILSGVTLTINTAPMNINILVEAIYVEGTIVSTTSTATHNQMIIIASGTGYSIIVEGEVNADGYPDVVPPFDGGSIVLQASSGNIYVGDVGVISATGGESLLALPLPGRAGNDITLRCVDDGEIYIDGTVSTRGGHGSAGGASGNIDLRDNSMGGVPPSSGDTGFYIRGALYANGGNGGDGPGGPGGEIIARTGGTIVVDGSAHASGGDSLSSNGGDGGRIGIEHDGLPSILIIAGELVAIGGEGGGFASSGGDGGLIETTSTVPGLAVNEICFSIGPGSEFLAKGEHGLDGANGGSISLINMDDLTNAGGVINMASNVGFIISGGDGMGIANGGDGGGIQVLYISTEGPIRIYGDIIATGGIGSVSTGAGGYIFIDGDRGPGDPPQFIGGFYDVSGSPPGTYTDI